MILFSSSRASVARQLLIHSCTKLQMKARVGVRATESGDKEGGRERRKEWEKERRQERLQKTCSEMFCPCYCIFCKLTCKNKGPDFRSILNMYIRPPLPFSKSIYVLVHICLYVWMLKILLEILRFQVCKVLISF